MKGASERSISDSRLLAKELLGREVFFSWDIPRTREGYYHYRAGLPAAIKRSLAFAPYADLLWLETKRPSVAEAVGFARQVRAPGGPGEGKWMVYNLSPSFNWLSEGFSEAQLKSFVWDLAKEGFVLQLVSLAGLHSGAAVTCELARRFKTDGMLAYVELVQRREKELGCDVLTHQKWSGANYVDGILQSVASSSATSSVGGDSTEHGMFPVLVLGVVLLIIGRILSGDIRGAGGGAGISCRYQGAITDCTSPIVTRMLCARSCLQIPSK